MAGDTVTATQIADNAVGTGQLAGIARGKIIYGDSNGDPQLLALGSNGQALVTDGTDISWGSAGETNRLPLTGGTLTGTLGITSNTPIITFIESDQSNKEFRIGSFGSAYAIYDASNSQYRYVLDTNGNHIFNEGGAAVDFRIEGDTEQNLFFVDGSADKIGIGTASPDSPLEISSSDDTRLKITDTGDSSELVFRSDGANTQIYTNTSHDLDIYTSGNNANQLHLEQSNGNVGINSAASNAKLEVVATSGEVFRADANNGAFRLVINQTDVQASLMRVTAGAVSAPSYSFVGDTTTGMSRPTGSAINFVCGGTEKARVDTNGIKITHTSNTPESAGQPDLGKTTFGGIHFESGSSGSSRGITWEASDGQTQAGYVVHNNGSDGTHHGWFATNTYGGGPYCRMKLSNYGNLILGAATDIGNVSAASTSSIHSNYGDILCNATNNDIILSDLLPGYSRNAYATIKSTGSYMYFSVNGAYSHYLASSGGLTASDSRLKENVSTLTNSLSKVKQLRGVNFTWKDTEKRGSENNIGFIAQEVETIYPELVGDGGLPKDENGEDAMKAVNYEKLVPVLVEAIKELEARIKTLEG